MRDRNTKAQVLTFFFFFFSFSVSVLNVSWGNFYVSGWTSSVFFCQYPNVSGLPAIFPFRYERIHSKSVFVTVRIQDSAQSLTKHAD